MNAYAEYFFTSIVDRHTQKYTYLTKTQVSENNTYKNFLKKKIPDITCISSVFSVYFFKETSHI